MVDIFIRYQEARSIQRKIIYHAGPTNSGKTYHALECFTNAKSGIYCGPLRLLANEIFYKTNEKVRNYQGEWRGLIVVAQISYVEKRLYCELLHSRDHPGSNML